MGSTWHSLLEEFNRVRNADYRSEVDRNDADLQSITSERYALKPLRDIKERHQGGEQRKKDRREAHSVVAL